jgi:hypothetical protein
MGSGLKPHRQAAARVRRKAKPALTSADHSARRATRSAIRARAAGWVQDRPHHGTGLIGVAKRRRQHAITKVEALSLNKY